MPDVDLDERVELLGVVAVVRDAVVRVGDADVRVAAIGRLVADHEREHAADVALQRQVLSKDLPLIVAATQELPSENFETRGQTVSIQPFVLPHESKVSRTAAKYDQKD